MNKDDVYKIIDLLPKYIADMFADRGVDPFTFSYKEIEATRDHILVTFQTGWTDTDLKDHYFNVQLAFGGYNVFYGKYFNFEEDAGIDTKALPEDKVAILRFLYFVYKVYRELMDHYDEVLNKLKKENKDTVYWLVSSYDNANFFEPMCK